jgi:hypothetical protein
MRPILLRFLVPALLAAACAPTIPQPCLVGRADLSPYAVTITLKAGQTIAPECASATPPTRVEEYSVEKYDPPNQPSTLALRPLNLLHFDSEGNQIDIDPGHPSLAQGDFTSADVDASGLCTVPTLSLAQQDFPDGSGGTVTFAYRFSDMRFLDSPEYQGSQMAASLHYTEGTCEADYDVIAVWPIAECATTADCNPAQDIQAGIFGSGINAAYPVVCDADAQLCVLTGTTFPQTSGFVSP